MGHADLTPQTLKLLEAELSDRLQRLAQPGSMVLVRAGCGLPVAAGRAARRARLPLVVVLPSQDAVPALLSGRDQAAAGELLFLAAHVRLLSYDPADRDACVSADERLVCSSSQLLAVWDGSPAHDQDATADVIAYAHGRRIATETLWAPGYARYSTLPLPEEPS
ncbi:hypothetical protein [Streptomyces sp. CT34]|uniref:hypothetical protein n=1 Tax=Streptomyces sp. CT34 TaxID=1553907 RepID=UPI00099D4390|nr:hypothetical protein [Streptomyces sp. CT34]